MVDGNVVRVIARLRAISANPKESITVKKLWWAVMTPTTFLLVFIFYYGTRFIIVVLDTILPIVQSIIFCHWTYCFLLFKKQRYY